MLAGCMVVAVVVSAAGGFWLGLREGWELALMADSARIGSGAVPRLTAIKLGQVNALNTALELDVDNGLIWSHYYIQSPLHPFLAPVWGLNAYPENRKEMARLAGYRREHPALPIVDGIGLNTRAAKDDSVEAMMDERRQIVDEMVRHFAPQP